MKGSRAERLGALVAAGGREQALTAPAAPQIIVAGAAWERSHSTIRKVSDA
ncbi:hypothetical protein ACU635_29315 [[Actinomadura] parvosata]|uniref:hypothetical protein n=1 Tax=[Actinomadura] parvosata TaxID=1955412 RepID=UPI00406C8FA2